MKTITALLAWVGVLATASFSQAKVDFSDFEGTYKGAYNLTADTTILNGTLTAVAQPSKNGSSIVVTFYGSTLLPPTSLASFATIKLTSQRDVSSNSALIGYYTLIPAFGKFSGQKNRFSFLLAESALNSSIAYTLKFTNSKLILTGSGAAGTTPLFISFNGKKKK